jgi:hypothetical protein
MIINELFFLSLLATSRDFIKSLLIKKLQAMKIKRKKKLKMEEDNDKMIEDDFFDYLAENN